MALTMHGGRVGVSKEPVHAVACCAASLLPLPQLQLARLLMHAEKVSWPPNCNVTCGVHCPHGTYICNGIAAMQFFVARLLLWDGPPTMHLLQRRSKAGKAEPEKLHVRQQWQLPRTAALQARSMTAHVLAVVAALGQPREHVCHFQILRAQASRVRDAMSDCRLC